MQPWLSWNLLCKPDRLVWNSDLPASASASQVLRLTVFVTMCLSQGFYSSTNIMTKKQVGEERVYSVYTSTLLFITKEVRLELKQVRKQEMMQRPWRDVPYWLASPGLLSLLSYRTQDYQPRDGSTHKGPLPLDH